MFKKCSLKKFFVFCFQYAYNFIKRMSKKDYLNRMPNANQIDQEGQRNNRLANVNLSLRELFQKQRLEDERRHDELRRQHQVVTQAVVHHEDEKRNSPSPKRKGACGGGSSPQKKGRSEEVK